MYETQTRRSREEIEAEPIPRAPKRLQYARGAEPSIELAIATQVDRAMAEHTRTAQAGRQATSAEAVDRSLKAVEALYAGDVEPWLDLCAASDFNITVAFWTIGKQLADMDARNRERNQQIESLKAENESLKTQIKSVEAVDVAGETDEFGRPAIKLTTGNKVTRLRVPCQVHRDV
jgi:hypothetical protein